MLPSLPRPFFSVLQLATSFPRPVGDSSNPKTHGFPVQVRVIPNATVDAVIYDPNSVETQQALVFEIVRVAREEIDRGALIIGTSCGFLGAYQTQIAQQLPVPFLSSSLQYLSNLDTPINANKGVLGILTFDAKVLNNADWFKRIAPARFVMAGLPKDGHLYRVIRNNETHLNSELAQHDVMSAAIELVQTAKDQFGLPLSEVLFECTNLGPYQQATQDTLGCPVIDYNLLMANAWAEVSGQASNSNFRD
jgi:hypothetical protein